VAVKKITVDHAKSYRTSEGQLFNQASRHPNICQFYGICLVESELFIVMEKINGGELLKYLKTHKLDDSTKCNICMQISAGIMHLHSKKIVHGDIAARNVLIDGRSNRCVVCDFGLSHTGDKDVANSTLPLRWIPPETFTNQSLSIESDIWMLGVCLWEVWANGQLPYANMKNSEVLNTLATLDSEDSSPITLQVETGWPPCAHNALSECLHVKPENRGSAEFCFKQFNIEHTVQE